MNNDKYEWIMMNMDGYEWIWIKNRERNEWINKWMNVCMPRVPWLAN